MERIPRRCSMMNQKTLVKRVLTLGIALGMLGTFGVYITYAGNLEPIKTKTHLKVGDPAPDFTLPSSMPLDGKDKITLSDFKGKKNVVLSFHVLDWTPT